VEVSPVERGTVQRSRRKKLDISEIMTILPHRYPFVLIDRVLEITPGEKIVALKNVTMNEPFFQGHFPGKPIMPGVLIVEAMAQAGGVLAFSSLPEELKGSLVYFLGMDKVKFRRPVLPGDSIVMDVGFLKKSTWAARLTGRATVEGKKVCEAELLATYDKRGRGSNS
jgi:beta-hydroxyacyl-ACP dehydratase FabZ